MAINLQDSLLDTVKKAVEGGILLPQDYSSAITASKDDPEVVRYLEGLMPKTPEAIPASASNSRRAEVQAQRERVQEQPGESPKPADKTRKPKKEAEVVEQEGDIITREDILGSETLRRHGVKPGDRLIDGKVKRVFSTKEDSVELGHRVTAEDLAVSPRLRELDAQVGDRIVNKALIPASRDDAWMQLQYGFDEPEGFGLTESLGVFLESRIPIGELSFDFTVNSLGDLLTLPLNMASYSSPDELYGEGFSQAPPEQRREMILAKKERDLEEKYNQFFEPNPDSAYRTAGNVLGQLADPTTLLPAGRSYLGMAGIGGAVAGSSSVVQDLALEGDVDWTKAALSTAAGSVLATATGKVINVVGGKVADRGATKLQNKAQKVADSHINLGGTVEGIMDAWVEAGINPQALAAAATRTGKKIKIPNKASRAEQAVEESITRDSAVARKFSKGVEKFLGVISTRIGNISESILGGMRRFEYNTHVKTGEVSKIAEPFLREMKGLQAEVKKNIAKHLYNGNFNAARKLMSDTMVKEFDDKVLPLLDSLGTELQKAGHAFTKVDNYFPRPVKDYDGLSRSLGKEQKGYIEEQLEAYARKKKTKVTNLSDQERSQVIDLALRGYRQTTDGAKLRFAKQRKLDEVTEDQLQYYSSPEEALSMYLRNSIHDLEKRKFFGRYKSIELDEVDGKFNTSNSIGELVRKAKESGEIAPEREAELAELLSSRFVGGEQTAGAMSSTIKDLGYMGTIANPISAIRQLGDVGISSALYGFRNTIAAMFGTKQLNLIDNGLEQVITNELAVGDPRITARALDKLFTAVGFRAIDRLSKETVMNSAFKKAQQMVKSPKGEAAFRKKIGKLYGDDTEALIADLKAGEITENVKFYGFNELSGLQPLNMLEMPQAYADMKGGRILYMLKSFTVKQLDMVRREVLQEWKKGNKTEAVKKAGLLAGYITAANLTTQTAIDVLLGKEVKPEDIPDKALWALLGNIGMNEYMWNKYLKQGKIVEGTISYVSPATPIIDALLTLGTELPKDDPKIEATLRAVPGIGPFLYNWLGGGAEKYNERQKKKRRDERRGRD